METFTYLEGDPPVTCPYCAARTDFTENPDSSQTHTCLNPACGVVFRMEEDTDPRDEEDEEDADD